MRIVPNWGLRGSFSTLVRTSKTGCEDSSIGYFCVRLFEYLIRHP